MVEIHVVRHDNSHLYEMQMEQYFQRRYEVFVEERGWKDIERADRRDVDQFDTAEAIHLLALEKDEVIGGLRLNPTTGPTLMSEVFSHLCSPPLPRSPDIWEGTRLWVVKERRHQKVPPAIEALLIVGSLEFSLALGIKKTRALFETWRLRRNAKLGWPMSPLGPPKENRWNRVHRRRQGRLGGDLDASLSAALGLRPGPDLERHAAAVLPPSRTGARSGLTRRAFNDNSPTISAGQTGVPHPHRRGCA